MLNFIFLFLLLSQIFKILQRYACAFVIELVGLIAMPFESNGKAMKFFPSSRKLKIQKKAPKLYSRLIQAAQRCRELREPTYLKSAFD